MTEKFKKSLQEDSMETTTPTPVVSEPVIFPEVPKICPYCNGLGKTIGIVEHSYTHQKKMISVPCKCFISTTVSNEYKLLKYLGGQYMDPDKLDPRFSLNMEDLSKNENLLLTGPFDALTLLVKALIMKYRFDPQSPRILFSRSIDIVHDFHVPQEDGMTPHLSSLSNFGLIVAVFGTLEKNQALALCMAQMVQNRLEERKPVWIYFPETMPALWQFIENF